MAETNQTTDVWNYLFVELADPRTNDWPMIKSPVPGLTIIAAYLYFVLHWGPKYMANRKPFKLEKTLIVYNFIQVLVSMWLVFEGLDCAWMRHYSWRCQPVDTSNTPQAYREARGVYVYFLAKISELLDTVFFVLRKRDRQMTFLHLYHHTVMPMISWGTTKYYPGGHGTFIGLINSFVHIIMYAYYLLSALGPKVQKYLWWKKYITNMQMIQFCMAFIHQTQLLYTDCGYPRWSVCFTLPNAVFFYFLFNDFYQKSYKKKKAAAAAAAKVKAEEAERLQNSKDECENNNNITAKNHNQVVASHEASSAEYKKDL
ncbi:elongation of very long chain fatty acids protein AAEL008004 [Eupeodes corollae]|uniref:elongation of very long chain fatty acids protein AAEL008004 n=1 Tax=Eupeodes corollae TaxID=290404 RepID=UPI0024918314|nr:elongation of very long chain fatty acids protein AAEL008004 [Eupeodes corollae]XP_055906529.1 elongation of very long chain fatty acids protein AAEL008004 [Eupeodes corollae]